MTDFFHWLDHFEQNLFQAIDNHRNPNDNDIKRRRNINPGELLHCFINPAAYSCEKRFADEKPDGKDFTAFSRQKYPRRYRGKVLS